MIPQYLLWKISFLNHMSSNYLFRIFELIFLPNFFYKFFNKFFYLNKYKYYIILIRNIVALILIENQRQRHFFHLVSQSPWPLFVSIFLLPFLLSIIGYLHFFSYMGYSIFLCLFLLLLVIFFWFSDIIAESRSQHTRLIQKCLLWAFGFFIASEVMFFLSFFWAFFHSSLSPEIWISCTWPPLGMNVIYPWKIPLLNTVTLIISGITLTWSHKALVSGMLLESIISLIITLMLAIFFLWFQSIEYYFANFSIYDGIYGSCFFMLTGFHGMHVLLGTIMLFISLFRMLSFQYSKNHHIGYVVSIWYWHFVDVVWIFLFIFIYWWGNSSFVSYEDTLVLNDKISLIIQQKLLNVILEPYFYFNILTSDSTSFLDLN